MSKYNLKSFVDIPERSTLYYAETLPQAQDYIKGYKKYNTSKKNIVVYKWV